MSNHVGWYLRFEGYDSQSIYRVWKLYRWSRFVAFFRADEARRFFQE